MSDYSVCSVAAAPNRFVPLPRHWCTWKCPLLCRLESMMLPATIPDPVHYDPRTKAPAVFPRKCVLREIRLLCASYRWRTQSTYSTLRPRGDHCRRMTNNIFRWIRSHLWWTEFGHWIATTICRIVQCFSVDCRRRCACRNICCCVDWWVIWRRAIGKTIGKL